MPEVRVLVVAGSARPGSFNRRLADVASGMARQAGASVTDVDLRALGLPVYDAEIEAAGLPAGALELRRLFATHDAVVVASPEYNGFPTPLLINAFDWTSRVPAADGLPSGLATTAGKVCGVVSASPGALGGLRSLLFVRQFLSLAIGMLVVPEQFALVLAGKAFDNDGKLVNDKQQAAVQRVVDAVLRTATALKVAAA
jgi:chromate reductase, NAD(P)H dehydrogenase (quinone)